MSMCRHTQPGSSGKQHRFESSRVRLSWSRRALMRLLRPLRIGELSGRPAHVQPALMFNVE